MGLAKLSDGTSSTQKQYRAHVWTKKGAAIVAHLIGDWSVPIVKVIGPEENDDGYDIACMTEYKNRRVFTGGGMKKFLMMRSCTYEELEPGTYLIKVTSV